MFEALKTWFLSKFAYIFGVGIIAALISTGIVCVEKIKVEKDYSKLKVELTEKNSIIEKNKVELKYKDAIIESQKKSIEVQNKTIELANSMSTIRETEIKKFNSNVDLKIKPINDLITEIRSGNIEKSNCKPSQSIKKVITTMQTGVSK